MDEQSHVVYPIPLRAGLVVRIMNLPDDLTKAEAERIAAVLLALAEKPMTPPEPSEENDRA